MIIQVAYARCDGCDLRVEIDHLPDTWRKVLQNGEPETMYCSSLCYAGQDGVPHESIVTARRKAFHLSANEVRMLEHIALGMQTAELACSLGFAQSTIKNRMEHVYDMLDSPHHRLGAVLVAGHLGLVDLATLGARIRRTAMAA